jgi:hypothetical protein
VPIDGQHVEPLAPVQSALSTQICIWHAVPHAITWPPISQHGLPPQSSVPSHVAVKPAHCAFSATQIGPLMKSAQHFCAPVHVVAPHCTPADEVGASIMPLPLPALPAHTPFTHG